MPNSRHSAIAQLAVSMVSPSGRLRALGTREPRRGWNTERPLPPAPTSRPAAVSSWLGWGHSRHNSLAASIHGFSTTKPVREPAIIDVILGGEHGRTEARPFGLGPGIVLQRMIAPVHGEDRDLAAGNLLIEEVAHAIGRADPATTAAVARGRRVDRHGIVDVSGLIQKVDRRAAAATRRSAALADDACCRSPG